MPGFDDDDVPDFSQRVRAFTSRFDPQHPSLPLTHIAPMYAFRAIIGGNSIQPQHCDTLGEDLSYLFYGRPAFRAKRETGPKLKWSVPVLFILDPAKTYSIKRVVPFDSGAFKKGFYGNVFSDRSKLDHFLLEPSLESAQRIVTAFYGSNKQYYQGQSEKSVDLTDFDFELQGLNYLAQQPGLQATSRATAEKLPDERASAVEIQIDEPIDIPSSLISLIVPETLLPNAHFQKAVKRWGLAPEKIDPYASVTGPSSEAWVGQFYEKVRALYQARGYFDNSVGPK